MKLKVRSIVKSRTAWTWTVSNGPMQTRCDIHRREEVRELKEEVKRSLHAGKVARGDNTATKPPLYRREHFLELLTGQFGTLKLFPQLIHQLKLHCVLLISSSERSRVRQQREGGRQNGLKRVQINNSPSLSR